MTEFPWEPAARTAYNKHRNQWAMPAWDDLPIDMRLSYIATTYTFLEEMGRSQSIKTGRLSLQEIILRRSPVSLKGKGKISEFNTTDERGFDWEYRREDQVWEHVRTHRLIELLPIVDLKYYLQKIAGEE